MLPNSLNRMKRDLSEMCDICKVDFTAYKVKLYDVMNENVKLNVIRLKERLNDQVSDL